MPKGIWNNGLKPVPPSRKGTKLTASHKARISSALMGNTWNRGRVHSGESTRLKRENSARYWTGKRGKEHPAWKELKITPLYQQVRNCKRYAEWRTAVFKRDRYTCVLCLRSSEVSGKLEADHFPTMFAQIFLDKNISSYQEAMDCEELWDNTNGRTLCIECHNPTRGRKPTKSSGRPVMQ